MSKFFHDENEKSFCTCAGNHWLDLVPVCLPCLCTTNCILQFGLYPQTSTEQGKIIRSFHGGFVSVDLHGAHL